MYKKRYFEYRQRYFNLKRELGKNVYDQDKFEFLGVFVTIPIQKKEFIDFDESNFIYEAISPNIDKILYLDNIKQFDIFTNKYGEINKDFIYINWDDVSKDFKGIGLNIDSNNELFKRFGTAIYKGNEYNSWWELEYDIDLEKVALFIEGKEKLGRINEVKIKTIELEKINPYNITNNSNESDKHKILYLENVKQFDEFTNKYGSLDKDFVYIFIDWKKVAKDFRGFGLNIKKLKKDRYKIAKYKDGNYKSWWDYEYDIIKIALFD